MSGNGVSAAQAGPPAFKDAPLPDQCPPPDALPPGDTLFIRLVPTDSPTAADFLSCHLEGKTPQRRTDPCAWRAVSFFLESTPKEVLSDIASFRNHANKKFKAYIRVTDTSGVVKVGPDGNHVSFWMYDTFAPETVVEKTEAL
jgi:hypothetical protein